MMEALNTNAELAQNEQRAELAAIGLLATCWRRVLARWDDATRFKPDWGTKWMREHVDADIGKQGASYLALYTVCTSFYCSSVPWPRAERIPMAVDA